MLPITRRPSPTTYGRVANLLSSNTIWATAREAGLPDPIATPMSASLSARTSLTPSPVIATVWSRACRAWTMARFWSGRTRPKVVYSAIASASASGWSGSSRASIVSPCRPRDAATAPTETALSPEITFTETFWEAK